MAPLIDAISVQRDPNGPGPQEDRSVYRGTVDGTWTVAAYACFIYSSHTQINIRFIRLLKCSTGRYVVFLSTYRGFLYILPVTLPCTGYALGLVIQACMEHQRERSSPHRDPIHVTAHFLRSTAVAPFKVHVRTLRTGRGYSNILAELKQKVFRALTQPSVVVLCLKIRF